jgi:hypothetical protein
MFERVELFFQQEAHGGGLAQWSVGSTLRPIVFKDAAGRLIPIKKIKFGD